jgi:hypothetical protein
MNGWEKKRTAEGGQVCRPLGKSSGFKFSFFNVKKV